MKECATEVLQEQREDRLPAILKNPHKACRTGLFSKFDSTRGHNEK